jgi:WD40 repeat protein
MTTFQRSKLPSFDVSPLKGDSMEGGDVLLISGGGGKTKSGVLNSIEVARGGPRGLEYENGHETGVHLCNSLATGKRGTDEFIAGGFSGDCGVYAVTREGSGLRLNEVVRFKADFSTSKDGADLKCSCFVTRGSAGDRSDASDAMYLVTGGEDGTVRLWKLEPSKGGGQGLTAEKVCDLARHDAPVMSLSAAPQGALAGDLVLSASKDGTLAVWDAGRCCEVDTHKAMVTPGTEIKTECRSAVFSSGGSRAHAILCGRQSTHLASYDVRDGCLTLSDSACIATVASTRMVINNGGQYVGVGLASGEVAVYAADSLSLLTKRQVHSFTVTGLTFFTAEDGCESLVSVSVDSQVVVTRLSDLTSVMYQYAHRYFPQSLIEPESVFGNGTLRKHLMAILFVQLLLYLLLCHLRERDEEVGRQ